MTDSLPVACSLSPAALAARREGPLRALATRAEAREALASGWRVRFAADADVLRAPAMNFL
jgi:hypothetical protein